MRTIRVVVLLAVTTAACAPAASRSRPSEPGPARKPGRPLEEARVRPPAPPAPSRPSATRADDGPLTAKIDPATPAGRAAALRLTEEGRQKLAAGEAARAIELLERAVAVDARVPYAYYFLARAHAANGRRELAYRFLDRAEQKLAGEPYWRSEVERVRGQLLAEDGKTAASDAAYRRALDAWPGNRAASEALTGGSRRGKESP
jgi:hypothetical protein